MDQFEDRDQTNTHAMLSKGTMVSHYRIIDRIGAGGMGEVFLAEDTKLHRQVALKFLPVHLAANSDVRTRFQREAQAVARLNHPNIVTIHEVGDFVGRPYFVMEHIDGQSLHHFAHDERLPIDQVVDFGMQICQGLAEAHRAGIVHRDIKTTNIVVDKGGRARILDFGLAATAGDEKLTRTGSTLGTVAYMSPEQVSGREIDKRSDLFSFGVILYELIAGRTPFRRDNEGATLRAILQEAAEPLTRYKSDVPDRLQQIVGKLLEKDRTVRYQSAEDIIADLKRLTYDSQQTGYRAPVAAKSGKRMQILLGAAALVVIVAVSFYFVNQSEDKQSVEPKVPMIAVLPFENLGAPEDEYFAEGMTEEITSRLAMIDGLGVISRTSAMNYILEGTVRWSKGAGQPKVRITPQLIRVSDDRHMWATNYEREMQEVFAVQEDIATRIVDQLGITLLESDRKTLATRPTNNTDAYDYYLKGINALRLGDWTHGVLSSATANLDSAVMADPTFALAWAERSRAYSMSGFFSRQEDLKTKARESYEQARRLEPNLPQGHLAAGLYHNLIETDYEHALEEYYAAKSELHNDANLLSDIAIVKLRQGKYIEAQESFAKAVELDPLNPNFHMSRGDAFRFTRSLAESEKSMERAISIQPERAEFHRIRIGTVASRYADWKGIEPAVREALLKADSVDLVSSMWRFNNQMPDFPYEKLFQQYIARGIGYDDSATYYSNVGYGYRQLGNSKASTVYLDSARIVYELSLKSDVDNPHYSSSLGLTLAYLGQCEQAEKYGLRGKELLSFTKCHW